MFDSIIIGAGASGLSAAIYALSRGMNIIVLEKDQVGGVIGKVSKVSHFESVGLNETGEHFIQRVLEQLNSMKKDVIVFENAIEVKDEGDYKTVITDKNTYKTKTVIFANGTTANKLEADKSYKNISYNAFKDGLKYKDKEVFVVGGSDGALKEALYLVQIAKKVHLVHFEESFTGIDEFKVPILNNKKIKTHLLSVVHSLDQEGDQDKVVLRNVQTNELEVFKGEDLAVFVYIGSKPNSSLLKDFADLENGYVVTTDDMRVKTPGIFVAGDIRKKGVRQVATAVNDGAIAAISAKAFLK